MEIIEPARVADVGQLTDLLTVLFAQEADFTPNRSLQEQGLRLIIESPHIGIVFVARNGSDIVGMVSLLFTISTAQGGRVCWLEDMVIRSDRRGGGLGTRLLQHAIGHARSHGCSRITLLTDQGNAGAIHFYGRHGFAKSEMTALRLFVSTKEAAGQMA